MSEIAGRCELCDMYVDELYDASALAETFGFVAKYRADDVYCICPDCLNNLEEMVRGMWHKKIEE